MFFLLLLVFLFNLAQTAPNCGTVPTELPPNIRLVPNATYVFNAPFDIGFTDFFEIVNMGDSRVFYQLGDCANKRVFHSNHGILKKNGRRRLRVGFRPFVYNSQDRVNDQIEIAWVKYPSDAPKEAKEDKSCRDQWLQSPKVVYKYMKIEYNV